MQSKVILALIIVILIALGGTAFYFFSSGGNAPTGTGTSEQAKVITENLALPDTTSVNPAAGSIVVEGTVAVPLVPESEGEKIIVPNAVLTVKGTVTLALPEAKKWAKDAKLVFVKSLGAVTLEGKSSQWQIMFDSQSMHKAYEIIVRASDIISRKEIDSSAQGGDVPTEWKDSDYPIRTLQTLPQFADATVSAISFAWNADGKLWRYNLSTSRGPTSTGIN